VLSPFFFYNFSLERLSRPCKENVHSIRTNIIHPQKQNSRNMNEVQVQYKMKQEPKYTEILTVSCGFRLKTEFHKNHKV
jgi:hypothetical protein